MKNIIKRFCDYFVKYNIYPDYKTAMDTILEDGTFSNVNYACESRSTWNTSEHLTHTAALAIRYCECGEDTFANMANVALAHWAKKDYRNSNWWHNDIGVPQKLMHIALFLGEKLTKSNKDYVLSRLPSSVEAKWTGANKNWLAENVICKGLLAGDPSMIKAGSEIIRSTVLISERGDEGIQKDYSFAQHGMQLYNHGYGRSFMLNSAKWAYVLVGSDFEFFKEEVDILTDFVLQGSFKMHRFNTMDFHARSREIVRGCVGLHGDMEESYLSIIESLIVLNSDKDKVEKLKQVLSHIQHKTRMPAMEGNHMYYCMDFMTQVKEKYYASVRHASKNVLGGDVQEGTPVNYENLLAGFAAYGGVCYMVDGNEYYDIAPVWDWGMLPGVTSPHFELPVELGATHDYSFVGGVSDGTCGVIAADINQKLFYESNIHLTAKKACFMFENALVHLGCDVNVSPKQELNTTYNQCLLVGDVFVNGTSVKEKCFTDINIKSVYHNSIAYFNLDGGVLALDTRTKKGNWYRVYGAETTPKTQIEQDIFLLYQSHEKTDDTYAYVVVPGMDKESYLEYNPENTIKIHANTNAVQAVEDLHESKIGVVFYAAGSVQCGEYNLCADTPCILLYDIVKQCITICDPELKTDKINLSVNNIKITAVMPAERGVSKTIEF